jgi:hypothetical protein
MLSGASVFSLKAHHSSESIATRACDGRHCPPRGRREVARMPMIDRPVATDATPVEEWRSLGGGTET